MFLFTRTFRLIARVGRDRQAASAMEFALIAPVFCALAFGTIQYGVLMFVYTAMQDTARDAARKLAVGSVSAATAANEARSALPGWVPGAAWSIVASDVAAGGTQVSTSITIPAADATVIAIVPMPETLSANVVMRKEE